MLRYKARINHLTNRHRSSSAGKEVRTVVTRQAETMSANGSNDKYKEGKCGDEAAIVLTTEDKNARESVNNESEKTVTNAEDELHDGCIVLGENLDKGVRYVLISSKVAFQFQLCLSNKSANRIYSLDHKHGCLWWMGTIEFWEE